MLSTGAGRKDVQSRELRSSQEAFRKLVSLVVPDSVSNEVPFHQEPAVAAAPEKGCSLSLPFEEEMSGLAFAEKSPNL